MLVSRTQNGVSLLISILEVDVTVRLDVIVSFVLVNVDRVTELFVVDVIRLISLLALVEQISQLRSGVDSQLVVNSLYHSVSNRIIVNGRSSAQDQYNNLKACPVVTKAQFRSALKAYEKMLQDEFKYESWRVGSLGTDWINFESVNDEAAWWGYSGQKYAYGNRLITQILCLYKLGSTRIVLNDLNSELIKTRSGGNSTEQIFYSGQKYAYGTLYAHLASAYDEILNQYNTMDNIKSLSKTSDADIVKGYFAAKNAVLVMNDWKPDDNNRASKANVKKLLDEYHGRLVYDYNTTAAENLFSLQSASELRFGNNRASLQVIVLIL